MRVARWFRGTCAALAALILIALIGAWAVSQSAWGRNQLRALIEEQAAKALDGTLTIDGVSGSIRSSLVLHGVRFTHAGREVFSARSVEVHYSVWGWIRGAREFSRVRLVDPVIRLRESRNDWDAGAWVRPRASTGTAAAAVTFPSIEMVNGRLLVSASESVWRLPAELGEMNAELKLRVGGGGGTRVDILRLSFASATGVAGPFRARAASGALVFTPAGARIERLRLQSDNGSVTVDGRVGPVAPRTIDLQASLERFGARAWRAFTPLLDTIDLTADGTARLGGNVDRLTVRAALATSAGKIDADTIIQSLPNVLRITGTGQLANFDAQHVTGDPAWASAITGRVHYVVVSSGSPSAWTADVKLAGGPMRAFGADAAELDGGLHYDASVVRFDTAFTAYGATGRSAGTILTRDPLTIDVSGDVVSGLDPRALPPEWGYTPLDAVLNASSYAVHWTRDGWTARATLDHSTVEGATLLAGTTVDLSGAKDFLSVRADGNVRTLDARRMGRATGLTGLDDPIFVTDLNGHVTLSGQGRSLSELDLVAQAELTDSRAAAGATVPSATLTLTRKDHLDTGRVVGEIRGLNPATLGASSALASDINGQLDLTAVWRDDVPDIAGTMTARGTLRATKSVISDLPIDRGVVAGEWRDGAFTADSATLQQNNGVTFTGRGRVAISGATSSATFDVVAADVAPLEPWTGRRAHGAAKGSGTLQGAFDAPRIVAAFESPQLSDPSLGTFDRVSGTLDAVFREWYLDRMRGDLNVRSAAWSNENGPIATAVTAQGTFSTRMHVTSARVQATMANHTAVRASLSADWEKELTADITALDATRGTQTWRLDPASGLLRVTSTHLIATNVQLSNGIQRVVLAGRVGLSSVDSGGDADDVLSGRATAIDLAALDEFFGLSTGARGQMSGEVSLTGRLADPRGRITLAGRDLTVRGYAIAEAGGTIDLAAGGATSSLTMKQPDGVTLTVAGRAPLSWFVPAGILDPAVPSPTWDLTAVSDPINLEILGAMTPQLTELAGQAIIDVRIVGAAGAPKVTGTVAIADGSFHVPKAGTSFSKVTADIGLGVDTLTVRRFTARDKHDHLLTISGELAKKNDQSLNRLNVHVDADHVMLVDNAIGTIELSSLLEMTGDVAHPRLTGNLEVSSGRVEVDRLLSALQGDPSALMAEADLPAEGVTAVDLSADAAAEAAAEAARGPSRSGFDSKSFLSGLAVDVRIFAPDNLILRGSQLRPGGKNSWSLGDLNVTVGGDLHATRAPGAAVKLRGDVTTIRGTYSFESRRFDIQRGGRIRFQDETPMDPAFDVRGVRTIQGVEARVDVRGRMSNPQLQLGSNVPLDEADVLSMIIFNRPANQLGDTQRADLVGAAASLAGGFVTAPLAASLGRALDLDLLELETVSFGQNVAPRVRVGQQLTSRLFVQLSQQFGAESLSELTGEYQLTRFLRVRGSTAQGPGSRAQRSLVQRVERVGLDLLFFFNY